MTNEQIYMDLNTVFEDVFDTEEPVTAETTAADVEDWDSIGHIRLMLAVEQQFAVKFNASEITSLKNVGELVALIRAKQGG